MATEDFEQDLEPIWPVGPTTELIGELDQIETNSISSDSGAVGYTEPLKEPNCTVCLDHFKEPKVLRCCHTFCKNCLERILEKSVDKDVLTCPQCRVEHQVPVGGVEVFLPDYTLDTVGVQSVEEELVTNCGECDNQTDPAVVYCEDCTSHLCIECEGSHKKMKRFRNHKLVTFDDSTPSLARKPEATTPMCCRQHANEPLKVYCKTCYEFVCCLCMVKNHQKHEFGLIDKNTRTEVERLMKSLTSKVQEQLSELSGNLQYIHTVEKAAVQRPGELKVAINKEFDSLVAALESCRKKVLEEADRECEATLKEIWAQKDCIERKLQNLTSSLTFSERSVQCDSDFQMLGLSTQAIPRLQELTSEDDLAADIDFAYYEVEKRIDEDELRSIGKLTSTEIQYVAGRDDLTEEDLACGVSARVDQEVQFRVYVWTKTSQRSLKASSRMQVPRVSITRKQDRMERQCDAKLELDCGFWTISFTPKYSGKHTVSVMIGDAHVENSPIVVNCHHKISTLHSVPVYAEFDSEGEFAVSELMPPRTED